MEAPARPGAPIAAVHPVLSDVVASVFDPPVDDKGEPASACTWGIARTLMSLNRFDEALPYWERIQADSPSDPSVKQMIERCKQGA